MRKLRFILAVVAACHLAPAQAAMLRVMTFNIHLGGLGDDGRRDLDRIADIILAADADIVALQEVDNDVPRSGNVNQVQRLGQLTGMQGFFGKARNLDGGAYGNGVLIKSGIGVVSTINRALPNPDNVETRAVLELNLSVDANASTTEFKFFATHFAHNSSAGRVASAHFINDLVSNSTVPSILAGDMNANPGSTTFNTLDSQWTDLTNVNNSGKNRANQIDYVFYRGNEWNEVTKSQFIVNPQTSLASDHHPLLGVLELPDDPDLMLVWNVNSGVATSFTEGFATGNGNLGVGAFPASPWDSPYNTGAQQLVIGYNGNATFSGSASQTIGSLRVGSHQANVAIAGHHGNGAMTASGSVSLTAASSTFGSGDVIVGEGGFAGTVNWNSSGTLMAQGKLRIGQGGGGTFNQLAGVVIGGNTPGSSKFVGIGVDAGSTGTYNLKGGFLRPSGGFAGTEFRQTLVGDNGAAGTLNVGDDVGFANSAVLESNDDLIVGRNGGTGALRVRNDARIELRSTGNDAELLVGQDGNGSVIQTGGLVKSDSLVRIGGGSAGVGHYAISGGSLTTASDGSGTFQIASDGAAGTLRIEGAGHVIHGAELFIASGQTASGAGRLELIGSTAGLQIGQLENAPGGPNGLNETILWQANANGVTPMIITGAGPAQQDVQLQDSTEAAANTGAGPTLAGDGIALELDLSAIAFSATLTLIDNHTAEPVTGFFENPTAALDLYEEGAAILGTGFNGTVNISYVGGNGNDVVLNLVASELNSADFDGDGDVDGSDFLTWQRGVGTPSGANRSQGDANNDGAIDATDLDIWKEQFPSTAATATTASIPEPTGSALLLCAACLYRSVARERKLLP